MKNAPHAGGSPFYPTGMMNAGIVPPPYGNGQLQMGVAGEAGALMVPMMGVGEFGAIEEDDRERLKDMLNRMQPPTVLRVGARDAEIVWQELDTSEAG